VYNHFDDHQIHVNNEYKDQLKIGDNKVITDDEMEIDIENILFCLAFDLHDNERGCHFEGCYPIPDQVWEKIITFIGPAE